MSVALTSSPPPTSMRQEPLRVMGVDDSVVSRGLISRWIASEPDMGVGACRRAFYSLPQPWGKNRNWSIPRPPPLTRRNAEISFKALSLGASDYIPKPESTRETSAADIFHHDLIQKIRSLGAKLRRTVPAVSSPALAPALDRPREPWARAAAVAQPQLMRRAFSMQAPRALVIGSSTGGPQALMTLVTELGAVIDRFPVLITQHMPPTFTTILAEHLARSSHRPALEAVDGEIVKAGQIYLAPGGRHMRVARNGTDVVIALDDGPPVNFCKPAVDPLFTSAINVWQGGVLAVVLTGMGSDGMRGGKEIVAAGGNVIAQGEGSSGVLGRPGAAAHAGICAAILPLNQIAAKLIRLFAGDRS